MIGSIQNLDLCARGSGADNTRTPTAVIDPQELIQPARCSEERLNLCVPVGKNTSRTLRPALPGNWPITNCSSRHSGFCYRMRERGAARSGRS